MRIAVVIGTRAELIKMFPVLSEIEERNHTLKFIHTGQHRISDMCELFNIPQPDVRLSFEPNESSKFKGNIVKSLKWAFSIFSDLKDELKEFGPDAVLYHGDTMSTAIAAFSSGFFSLSTSDTQVGHIEAGLRSGSLFEPFPEEIARRIADIFSNRLFAVSELTSRNLSHYAHFGKKVKNTGNTIVDSVGESLKIGDPQPYKNYGVVTIHRHENIKSRKRMKKIVEILKQAPRDLIFPIHDNTRELLEQYELLQELKHSDKIALTGLLEYPDFLHLLKNADIIYTDGGSIQEESLILEVPCILLRKKTERIEGLKTGLNYLSKLEVETTVEKAKELVNQDIPDFKNPYGETGVSKKIIDFLEKRWKN